MAYVSREFLDRVAVGDDKYYMYELEDGRIQLTPAPDSVVEAGTDINRELLQLMEDRIVWLMNRVYGEISANPFTISFDTLAGLNVTGVWNEAQVRVEC